MITLRSVSAITFAVLATQSLHAQATNVLNTTGNVGVGTLTPTSGIVVSAEGPNYTDGSYFLLNSQNSGFGGGATLAGIKTSAADYGWYNFLKFQNAGGVKLVVNGSGYLGLGTAAPESLLDIRFPANPSTDNGAGINVLRISTSSAIAADTGGALGLGGLADNSGHQTFFGQIAGRKSIAASQNYAGYLQFCTNSGGGTMVERMRITDAGNIGIGTTNPGMKLDVRQTAAGPNNYGIYSYANGAGTTNYAAYFDAAGAANNYALYTNIGNVVFAATSGNVGIGTTTPTQKLSVNGTVRAKEVVVETAGWSDYVLAKGYALAPLSEVEQHIQKEGHLPGIPSAAEVAEKGVGLGEMQAKLLAKIEELTLHVIAIEKENKLLKHRLDGIQERSAGQYK